MLTAGTALMVTLKDLVVMIPRLSVTSTTKLYVPEDVGVPFNVPERVSVSHDGSVWSGSVKL